MQYTDFLSNRFLPGNGLAPLPMPKLGSLKQDRQAVSRDWQHVGQDLLVGIRKAKECQQR